MAQINKPTDYFNPVTYVGNGTDAHAITGVGFQSNMTWLKNRDGANSHQLFDSVRGATKTLFVNETSAEATYTNTLQSFDSDGFTVGTSSGANTNANNFISWNWLAGGTASSNTDGSITSTVSANTTSGFSIVKYTGNATSGATIGHGLGVTPKIIIIKGLGTTYNWVVGHNSLSTNWTNYLTLSTSDALSTATNIFNDTAPTSSVFSIGNALGVNTNSSDYIAYCFAEKKGFSKFGSYVGNGSTDGTFVYTGFKPAFLIIKKTNASNNWHMYDNKRDTYNVADAVLYPNSSGAEGTDTTADFLSNGFKLRTTINFANGSGDSYIYMAFAENPLVGTNNIPTTAR